MSTGSATNVGDEKKSDLSAIIAELRTALGGVSEVAKLYGKPEGAASDDALGLRGDLDEIEDAYSASFDPDAAEEKESAEGETAEQPDDAYSSPFDPKANDDSLRDKLPKSAYDKPVLEENESAESDSEDSENYISDLKLNPQQSKTRIADESESKESESSLLDPYVSDLSQVLAPSKDSSGLAQPPSVADDPAANYAKARQETDQRLARLAKFLPDKVREALDKKFDEATKLAQPKSDEAYTSATEALLKLQGSLDSKAPELRTTEANYLRKQIQGTLDRDGNTLEPVAIKGIVDRFAALDNDLPAEEGDAKSQLESLQKLASEIDGSIQGRLKALNDLCVDFDRLAPIIERALSIDGDKHDDLEKASTEIRDGFGGKFITDGLSIKEIQTKLSGLERKLREAFKNFTLDDAKEEQKNSLPASPDSLKPKGEALGRGAFGEVFELKNDGDKKLVGKTFSSGDADAKKEMEHEAEIYARIGEHPHIAKCYGIHEVEGNSMLIMDKIEGKDVQKVFDDLDKQYRSKKISREEYLAATQHIIKGTLMGLAHMEAMGLVHKDIKGDNVKFDTRTNQAVLIDMGLAQASGKHENTKSFFPIVPPEQWAGRTSEDDYVVTPLWDSFTVGKMLFQEMERDDEGVRQTLVTGGAPLRNEDFDKDILPRGKEFKKATLNAFKRDGTGALKAQTDEKGQLVGQALKQADDPTEAAKAGKYGVATQYVDFMNRLTHPDPLQRMSTSEALKHPFMADTMLSGEQLDKVFGKPTGTEPKKKKKDEAEEKSDASEGPRLNLDDLADAYDKKSGDASDDAAEQDELEEESAGPRIDTDALAEAYKKGEKKNSYDLHGGEGSEDESDENKGPRIDTDELAAAYSKGAKQPTDDPLRDEDEDESEEKNKGPRIDTDALADAYKKDTKQQSYDPLRGEDSEDESDEEKGPRIDTDKLAAAYSGEQSADDDFDSLEDEAEDEAKKKKASKGKKKANN